MIKRSLTFILGLGVALQVACRSDSFSPEEPVLTTMEIGRANGALFPESTSQLTIQAWDQFGVPILERFEREWTSKAAYLSSAPQIAKVSSNGLVTAVAPGTARITATLTLGRFTASNFMAVTILSGPTNAATVTANEFGGWSPSTVRIKAGGTVTWVIPDGVKIGTIWLNVWDTNAEKLEFIEGRVTRTFSAPGNFFYGDGGGLMWYERGGLVDVY